MRPPTPLQQGKRSALARGSRRHRGLFWRPPCAACGYGGYRATHGYTTKQSVALSELPLLENAVLATSCVPTGELARTQQRLEAVEVTIGGLLGRASAGQDARVVTTCPPDAVVDAKIDARLQSMIESVSERFLNTVPKIVQEVVGNIVTEAVVPNLVSIAQTTLSTSNEFTMQTFDKFVGRRLEQLEAKVRGLRAPLPGAAPLDCPAMVLESSFTDLDVAMNGLRQSLVSTAQMAAAFTTSSAEVMNGMLGCFHNGSSEGSSVQDDLESHLFTGGHVRPREMGCRDFFLVAWWVRLCRPHIQQAKQVPLMLCDRPSVPDISLGHARDVGVANTGGFNYDRFNAIDDESEDSSADEAAVPLEPFDPSDGFWAAAMRGVLHDEWDDYDWDA